MPKTWKKLRITILTTQIEETKIKRFNGETFFPSVSFLGSHLSMVIIAIVITAIKTYIVIWKLPCLLTI